MRIGSLFSGYGGLDMAVQAVIGGDLAWYSEIEPAACKVLAAHHSDVPNLGDITAVDWSAVPPVDVLTGGYPCQPFSHAGQRKGTNDHRHLWPYVREALAALRPMVAVFENVDGHRSLGLDVVLGDLAALGLSARWGVVRAADAGAPHGRKRVFIVAYSSQRQRHEVVRHRHSQDTSGATWLQGALRRSHSDASYAVGQRHDRSGASRAEARQVSGWPDAQGPTDAAADTNGAGSEAREHAGSDGQRLRVELVGSTAPTADADRGRHGGGQDARGMGSLEASDEGQARQRQRTRREPDAGSDHAAADAVSAGTGLHGGAGGRGRAASGTHGTTVLRPGHGAAGADGPTASGAITWGKYEPAIRRWEAVIDRDAPVPTIVGPNGRPRLSPVFVEWMMGLPEGHVTGHGLSNAQALKMLGNGVVPQQAALALLLLEAAS